MSDNRVKKKPWSITTTGRNPYRLREWLRVLRSVEGKPWNKATQEEFQVLLIQNRLFGYGNQQFYSGLGGEVVRRLEDQSKDLSFDLALSIFQSKNYKDPPMRGRQSFNPLKKFGFARVNEAGAIEITDIGRHFLQDEFDLQEIFLRVLVKWQIPNPDNQRTFKGPEYNIKPFLGILHLISQVNRLELARGNKPKGISRAEFELFGPTISHWQEIETRAHSIVNLRKDLSLRNSPLQKEYYESFRNEYLGDFLRSSSAVEIKKTSKNLRDYADNAIRYFRLTSYVYLRGRGYYLDLEPRRSVEIESLLEQDGGEAIDFVLDSRFYIYISDPLEPAFSWETKDSQQEIIRQIIGDIHTYEKTLDLPLSAALDDERMTEIERRAYISRLRSQRFELQNALQKLQAQKIPEIDNCITTLKNIFEYESRPLLLEKTIAFGLLALDDAVAVHPNYPRGDDGEPTFTAPGNKPDIECFYESFNAICEVTMLKNRQQWFQEGQPVMRHLRDFEDKNVGKPVYCVFVAPEIHRDSLNTFWYAIRFGYEARTQSIIPLTIDQFTDILLALRSLRAKNRGLPHTRLQSLFDQILRNSETTDDPHKWLASIATIINEWSAKVLI